MQYTGDRKPMRQTLQLAGIVARKEIVDSLRDRRAIASAVLFGPLLGPVLFGVMIHFALSMQTDEAVQPIEIPVIGGAEADNLMAHLAERLVDADHETFASVAALREAVRVGDIDVGLVVAEDFGAALAAGAAARLWIVSDQSNNAARTAVARVRGAIVEYGRTIGMQRLALRGVHPDIAQPIAILVDDVSTPSGRAILLLGMMTYFLLFATLIGGTQVAIDATAGERERGSLEPLLTLPVPHAAFVLGKLAATFAFMAVSLAIAIASFAIAAGFLPLAELGMTANLTMPVCLAIFAVMLPFAVLGAGVMTIVASYSKSFREAQTYTGLATVAPTLPIVVVILKPLQASVLSMLAPSLSQHLLVTGLIKSGGADPRLVLVSAASTIALGGLCAFAAVRRYASEKLLI